MSEDVNKPVTGQEQSPTFQYMQEHVARGMANFYAAYRPQEKTAGSPSGNAQAKKGASQGASSGR